MEKERFTMLLLEPGEIYFEDFSSSLFYSENDPVSGRLKLCSKSMVFEPKPWNKPLLKIPFKDCTNIGRASKDCTNIDQNTISIKCKQYTEMMEGNIVAPYVFKYEEKEFVFLLNYASVNNCVEQMNQLQRASTLHAADQNIMIATISLSRHSRIPFDRVLLEDLYESILLEVGADRVSPLVQNPGRVILTEKMLYFQPFNNIEPFPVLKIHIEDMKQVFRRRFLLRQVGLEIYSDDIKLPHLYLALKCEEDRELLYKMITELPGLDLHRYEIEEMTMQWQNGVISNYNYLMYINGLADRSKNDLTQYPVFPWVVADYTSTKLDFDDPNTFRDLSKPMGALNEDRWEKVKERYDDMAEPKFMFGSHYSAPGLVLFYLVRKYPRYMLCLQNGRFDHPDRMFNTISDVYSNCLNNLSDFKELIPEFYDTQLEGDFLTNKFKIDFGYRHDGRKVGDVRLPVWAESPKQFIEISRDALECDFVSSHLHSWIDLIFGCKQRGVEAVKARNVFFHLCYEGAIDLDMITDLNERHALEVQIMEFGQVPKQIFSQPHVKKLIQSIEKPLQSNSESETHSIKRIELKASLTIHKEAPNCVLILPGGNKTVSVAKDGLLKVFDLATQKQLLSVNVGSPSLSSCVALSENIVVIGSWDNNIIIYDLEYSRQVDSFRAHDDSVSCLLWSEEVFLLISGGWDCVVRIWANVAGVQRGCFRPFQSLKAELDHEARITCLAVDCKNRQILSGTVDGDVFLWDLKTYLRTRRLPQHFSPLTGVCFLAGDRRMVSCSADGELRVTDLTDSVQVFTKKLSHSISCLHWSEADVVWLGCSGGEVLQWDLKSVLQICEIKAHHGAITGIYNEPTQGHLITASEDLEVKLWKEYCDN